MEQEDSQTITIINEETTPVPFQLFYIPANGIRHRVAIVRGKGPIPPQKCSNNKNSNNNSRCRRRSSFLVMLLHGWPESWYSWRHQLVAIADAGYDVCAPDMRGFGGTDNGASGGGAGGGIIGDYTIEKLCGDVLGIANALGYANKKLVLIGHDLGAWLAWRMALLHPSTVVAVSGLSVPFIGITPRNEPPMVQIQRKHTGWCLPQPPYCASRKEQEAAKFHYMLHHNLPGAAEQYDNSAEAALYRIYSNNIYDPEIRKETRPPKITDRRMFPNHNSSKENNKNNNNRATHNKNNKNNNKDHVGSDGGTDNNNSGENNKNTTATLDASNAVGWWDRMGHPESLPAWLPRNEFDYIVNQYRQSGFAGGLLWYQAFDTNWFRTLHLRDQKISQPALFLGGLRDAVITHHGGKSRVVQALHEHCTNVNIVFWEDAGHWIQQEKATEVNDELLLFLERLSLSSTTTTSTKSATTSQEQEVAFPTNNPTVATRTKPRSRL